MRVLNLCHGKECTWKISSFRRSLRSIYYCPQHFISYIRFLGFLATMYFGCILWRFLMSFIQRVSIDGRFRIQAGHAYHSAGWVRTSVWMIVDCTLFAIEFIHQLTSTPSSSILRLNSRYLLLWYILIIMSRHHSIGRPLILPHTCYKNLADLLILEWNKVKGVRNKSYPATKAKAFLLGALRNPTVNTDVTSNETARITSFQVLLWT